MKRKDPNARPHKTPSVCVVVRVQGGQLHGMTVAAERERHLGTSEAETQPYEMVIVASSVFRGLRTMETEPAK